MRTGKRQRELAKLIPLSQYERHVMCFSKILRLFDAISLYCLWNICFLLQMHRFLDISTVCVSRCGVFIRVFFFHQVCVCVFVYLTARLTSKRWCQRFSPSSSHSPIAINEAVEVYIQAVSWCLLLGRGEKKFGGNISTRFKLTFKDFCRGIHSFRRQISS